MVLLKTAACLNEIMILNGEGGHHARDCPAHVGCLVLVSSVNLFLHAPRGALLQNNKRAAIAAADAACDHQAAPITLLTAAARLNRRQQRRLRRQKKCLMQVARALQSTRASSLFSVWQARCQGLHGVRQSETNMIWLLYPLQLQLWLLQYCSAAWLHPLPSQR